MIRGGAPRLIESGRVNPGYLKLDLFCRGLRLAPDCDLGAHQGPVRMRSGLGSGLELQLPAPRPMPVNVPVVEPFASESPYELAGPADDGTYGLLRDGAPLTRVRLPERPAYFDRLTSSGKPMQSIGVLQGSYLGVYFGPTCANWKHPEAEACRFCSVGLNLNEGDEARAKTIDDIVETALAARDELGITFVHVNGGFDDRADYVERYAPLMQALRERTGLLLGLQIPPLADADAYRRFKALGVNNVSLCFEIWDPERFHEVCPGKDRRAGLAHFRQAIEWCAQDVGFDTTNGEMIAGLEDPASTRDAIDWVTGVGAVPTICVFRPVVGTAYADLPPPDADALAPVFAQAYRRCMEQRLPIGVAPGVHVSIVLTPEEWRWLLPPRERRRYRLQRWRLAAMRAAFRAWFAHRRRRHRRGREAG